MLMSMKRLSIITSLVVLTCSFSTAVAQTSVGDERGHRGPKRTPVTKGLPVYVTGALSSPRLPIKSSLVNTDV